MQEATPEQKREDTYRRLSRGDGFRERPSQKEMIECIGHVLSNDHVGARIAVIEAATGVGKSLAYLLGAFAEAQAADKTLVVATGTVALQNQLLTHDIPALAAAIGEPVTAAVSKGRNRYVCDYALNTAGGKDPAQIGLDLGDETNNVSASWDTSPTHEQRDQVEALIIARSTGKWNGDLDAYPTPLDDAVRQHVTLGRQACIGAACPFVSRCPSKLARSKISTADIVVTNHDTILSDLMLSGGGVLLPAPEDMVLVLDEAHELPDKAIDRFTIQINVGACDRTLHRLPAMIAAAMIDLGIRKASARQELAEQAITDVRRTLGEITAVFARLCHVQLPGAARRAAEVETRAVRWKPSALPDVVDLAAEMAAATKTLGRYMKGLIEKLREGTAGAPVTVTARHVGQLGQAYDVIQRVYAWTTLVTNDSTNTDFAPPAAFWIQNHCRGSTIELSLFAAPSDVAGRIRGWLLERAYAVILTSATLRTLGTFRHFVSRAGLGENDGTAYAALPSPFDLARQARIVIPATACDPRQEAQHTAAVAELISERASPDSGTLALFSSRRQMIATHELLPPAVAERVTMAGTGSLPDLLQRHRERVARGEQSILMGLESFSQGLDLAGPACEILIVARLPFRPPDGPVAETRAEWLAERGRSYFAEEATPEAYRRLVQRLGRLIRTETDHGTIYVMDRRLISTTYGRQMWNTLPAYTKVIEPSAPMTRAA